MQSMLNKPRASVKKKDAPSSVPMKKIDITRQRVLEVTSDLFRRNGYQATSMRDIAAALGMKSGSLYYYYESKEALLAAILNDNIDATLAGLKQVVADLPMQQHGKNSKRPLRRPSRPSHRPATWPSFPPRLSPSFRNRNIPSRASIAARTTSSGETSL